MNPRIERPNIFKISTKELTQDAFIVWLLQWADPQCQEMDITLHECGRSFLRLVMGTAYQSDRQVLKIKSGRQWDYIDVWAEIYFKDGSKTLLVIEDKTFTSEHSNQLERYKKQAENFCAENDFSLVCTFFKIGSEPLRALGSIKEKGFNIVTRKEIVEVLLPYRAAEHSILRDFIEYIDDLEKAHFAFQYLPLKDWKDLAWVGFYQYIESNIEDVNWHWVNNQSGGFWNLCLTWDYWNKCVPVYMQIEERKLCFKIALGEGETELDNSCTDITAIKDYVTNTLIAFAGIDNIYKIKRKGAGRGNYRTFAMIEQQDWCGDPHKLLDRGHVIDHLLNVLAFYRQFMIYLNASSFEMVGIKMEKRNTVK